MRILGAVLMFAAFAWADTISFSDGDFNDADYTSVARPIGSNIADWTASTESSGGNPGAYRRLSLILEAGEGIVLGQLYEVATFDPSSQGAVNSVAVSYDIRRVFTSDIEANQVARGLVARQDGVVHEAFLGVSTSTTW